MRRPLPAAALCLALLLPGCPGGTPPAATPGSDGGPGPDPAVAAALARRPDLARGRVLLLGLDGCDPALVEEGIAAGRLPHFRRLREEGALGPLRSQQPMLSPLLWTTVATGKWPTEHGVLDFMVASRDGTGRETVTSRQRKVEAIWDVAGRHGRTVAVVGWLASHPAERVNGFAVSERAEGLAYLYGRPPEEDDAGKCWPPGLLADLAPLRRRPADVGFAELEPYLDIDEAAWRAACTDDRFTPENRVNNLRLAHLAADNFRRAAFHLWREKRPALLCAYFEHVDAVSHDFMAFREPITWRPRTLAEIREHLAGRAAPAEVDRIHAALAAGAAAPGGDPAVVAAVAELSRGAEPARVAAWRGAVDAAYAAADRLLGEAMGLCDADTTLVVLSDHGFASGPEKPPFDSSFHSRLGGASYHRPDGILGLFGRGVRRGYRIPPRAEAPVAGARLLDVAPTALALLGFPKAADMPGRVLAEAFTLDLATGTIPTYEAGRAARQAAERADAEAAGRGGRDATEDAEVDDAARQVAALGYTGTAEEGPVRALLHMAASYREQGRWAEAEETLEGALRSAQPGMRARLLAELGEVRGRRGDDAGARKRFAEALAAQPGFPPAVVGLVRLDEERGDLPAVIAAWEDLVARFPARGEFHARLADALRRRAEGEPARAPADLRRAAELVLEATRPAPGAPPDPERLTPPGRNAFGMILLRQGAFEAALEQFRKAAAADPAYLRPRTNLGVLHLNLAGQARAALASGRVPAAERPAVEARAAAHREEALRRLGEVLAAAPAHAKALYNRAEVLWHLEPRDPAGARRDLEAALAAEPGYRRARDLLAEVLRQDAPVAAPR